MIVGFICCLGFRDWHLMHCDLFQQREILHEIQRRKEEIKEERKRKEMAKQVLCELYHTKIVYILQNIKCFFPSMMFSSVLLPIVKLEMKH